MARIIPNENTWIGFIPEGTVTDQAPDRCPDRCAQST